MVSEQDRIDRIQNYLLDRMSDEDRTVFEKELATDTDLFQQYQDLSLLAYSIQKSEVTAFRASLEEAEKQFTRHPLVVKKESELEEDLGQVEQELLSRGIRIGDPSKSANGFKTHILGVFKNLACRFTATKKYIVQHPYATRMAISFAVAASLALAIILPYNAKLASDGFNYAPNQLERSTFRGDSSDKLENAIGSYNEEDYKSAFSYLEEAKKDLEFTLSQLDDNDSNVLILQSLINELYQVEWYRALVFMKTKNVREAKKTLRAISKSESPFASDARQALENAY